MDKQSGQASAALWALAIVVPAAAVPAATAADLGALGARTEAAWQLAGPGSWAALAASQLPPLLFGIVVVGTIVLVWGARQRAALLGVMAAAVLVCQAVVGLSFLTGAAATGSLFFQGLSWAGIALGAYLCACVAAVVLDRRE